MGLLINLKVRHLETGVGRDGMDTGAQWCNVRGIEIGSLGQMMAAVVLGWQSWHHEESNQQLFTSVYVIGSSLKRIGKQIDCI
ncbi:hypothetical protein TSUD_278860 [Trifolium subterraneum]|uniref:Uncharacterized protein n=1 Tax=Trifolium subterraneum TaxID=3900 RepID=A0A2Z6P0E8_TRISU|nr:hypothetical protein TSUD_278860 [Trifolium subterraneum]